MHPAHHLQTLLRQDPIVRAPGAPDALTARLIQQAGFPAVYMTGLGATASRLGMPDIGLMSQTEMTTHARDLVRAVDLPVIADADTGYGGLSNLHRTVREHVQAGVAAIHLEDQVAPKRCGQMAGLRLIDAEEAAQRLRCAMTARGGDPLLVIGRTDALRAQGLDEAIRRARLYQAAGVDLVFVDGIRSIAEVEAVAAAVPGPKVVSLVDGTEAASLDAATLQRLGYSLVLYAVTTLFTAVKAVADALGSLQRDGKPSADPTRRCSYDEFTALVGLPFHQQLDTQFGG